jgi:hypothetical protein
MLTVKQMKYVYQPICVSECNLQPSVSDEKIDEIRHKTATDPKLQKVMQYTMSGWPTKFNSELN